ncbi:MAG: hypothetical protein R3D33_09205 [Hyphomicrobiaceae bacterium]
MVGESGQRRGREPLPGGVDRADGEEVADYIADMILELEQLARTSGHRALSALLVAIARPAIPRRAGPAARRDRLTGRPGDGGFAGSMACPRPPLSVPVSQASHESETRCP